MGAVYPPAPSRGTFLALLALKNGAKHGYEIASHLSEHPGGVHPLVRRALSDPATAGAGRPSRRAGRRSANLFLAGFGAMGLCAVGGALSLVVRPKEASA
jgi:hypothetical protein